MRCQELYFRVDRHQISLLRFIFEAYDGIGMISTLNPEKGIIVIRVAPGCETDVDNLLVSLSGQIRMEPRDGPTDLP